MSRQKIPFLNIESYEHPWDKSAREALEQVPGITTLIQKLNEIGFERMLRIQYTGSSLKVNQNNFPDVYALLHEACDILSIDRRPDLYFEWSYKINAFTAGVEKPVIVLNSGCIDLLTVDELLYVIAHELGHIKSNHVLYYQAASYLPVIAQLIGNVTLGIGSLLTTGLQLALLNWKRMSEFTADRAGLLAVQDPQIAASAMVKMAGLPQKYFDKDLVADFIQQAKEFEDYDFDTLDSLIKIFSTLGQSHPWTVMRGSELFKWIDTGKYQQILTNSDWRSATRPWQTEEAQQTDSTNTKPWRY